MNTKVHPLHEATPLRLGEVVVSPSVQKPTQRVKEGKESEKYVPNKNKINPQKRLIKWR